MILFVSVPLLDLGLTEYSKFHIIPATPISNKIISFLLIFNKSTYIARERLNAYSLYKVYKQGESYLKIKGYVRKFCLLFDVIFSSYNGKIYHKKIIWGWKRMIT